MMIDEKFINNLKTLCDRVGCKVNENEELSTCILSIVESLVNRVEMLEGTAQQLQGPFDVQPFYDYNEFECDGSTQQKHTDFDRYHEEEDQSVELESTNSNNCIDLNADVYSDSDEEVAESIKQEPEPPLPILQPSIAFDRIENEEADKALKELEEKFNLQLPLFVFDQLMPHQKHGVCFLWKSIHKGAKSDNGCILADYMGLGKTLQAVALIIIYLTVNPDDCVLVVCPKNVYHHWKKEFALVNGWLKKSSDASNFRTINPIVLAAEIPEYQRVALLQQWRDRSSVLVCTYDMFRNCVTNSSKYHQYFLQPGPDLIILDEGHKIKNITTGISKVINQIETDKRIVLTGYPLQNNLSEYYNMFSFVAPTLLGDYQTFKDLYQNPIMLAHSATQKCTEYQRKVARRKAWVLHDKLKHHILRRDVSLLKSKLPKKHEVIVNIRLSTVQLSLYKKLLDLMEKYQKKATFWAYNILTLLCNHPDILHAYYEEKKKKFAASSDLIAKVSSQQNSHKDKGSEAKVMDDSAHDLTDVTSDDSDYSDIRKIENEKDAIDLLTDLFEDKTLCYQSGLLASSGKMVVLNSLIYRSRLAGDKLVIFSRSINSLNFIETSLATYNKKKSTENPDDVIPFFRFDGSTNAQTRQEYIDKFNDKESKVDLLLVSTIAGGEGINLSGANRLVLLDLNWNPSFDCQACCRVFRIGQEKEVFIYKLVSDDTIEDKVQVRQMKKETLSNWVLDNNGSEFFELYSSKQLFAVPTMNTAPTPTVDIDINDQILLQTIQQCPQWIVRATLHEHLLIDDTSNNSIPEEVPETNLGLPQKSRSRSGSAPIQREAPTQSIQESSREAIPNEIDIPTAEIQPDTLSNYLLDIDEKLLKKPEKKAPVSISSQHEHSRLEQEKRSFAVKLAEKAKAQQMARGKNKEEEPLFRPTFNTYNNTYNNYNYKRRREEEEIGSSKRPRYP